MPLYPARQINFYNVKDYGARGDGITDDAATIQAAINASPVGSVIFFPGNHLIGSTIQLLAERSYVGTLQNQGTFFTFKQKNGSNLPALLAAYEWYNNQTFSGDPLRIADIILDCNSANNTTSHGIVIQNYYSLIREVEVLNAPASGIVVSSITRNGSNISSSTIVENRIESCKVQYAGQYGIWVHDASSKTTDGRIDSCDVSYCSNTAIQLDYGAGWFITGNHVYGAKQTGIRAQACWDTSIIGNEINGFGEGATADYWYGIYATLVGPEPTVITSNIIETLAEYNDSSHYLYMVVEGGGATDTHAVCSSNALQGKYVNTSSTSTVTSGTQQAVTPKSMVGIAVGIGLTVGSETITVGTVTSTSFTPSINWASTHGPGSYAVFSTKAAAASVGLNYQTTAGQQSSGLPCTVQSLGNSVYGMGLYNFVDSYITIGPTLSDGGIAVSQSPSYAVTSLSNGSTIPTVGLGEAVVTETGNVTGVILQAGTVGGQQVLVTNHGSFTITFAAFATSNVADGTSDVIAASRAAMFIWDNIFLAWYRI